MSDLLNAPLSEVDPLIGGAIDDEARRQAEGLELIASENFVCEAVLEAMGSVFTNKYAEGYPAQALLRRLRVRRRGRAGGHRPREGAVRRGARQRPAALGLAGQHERLPRGLAVRRHHPRHEPLARRPPHARPPAELLRLQLQGRRVRRLARHGADRLRGVGAPRAGAQPEDDRLRRVGLSAHHRLRAHRRHRALGRRRA